MPCDAKLEGLLDRVDSTVDPVALYVMGIYMNQSHY
jgi:hypothetical protein